MVVAGHAYPPADRRFVGFLKHHRSTCEMRLTYDNSATLSYHGTLIVAGGNEIETFRVTKPGTFLILIGVSMDGTYFPKITVAGDFREAEKFLMAFQMAGGAWI
jgi:hypothetical protein